MEGILKFDLSEWEDIESFKMHNQAYDLYIAISDFDQWLRNEIKYQNNEEAQKCRDKLKDFLGDVSLDILS